MFQGLAMSDNCFNPAGLLQSQDSLNGNSLQKDIRETNSYQTLLTTPQNSASTSEQDFSANQTASIKTDCSKSYTLVKPCSRNSYTKAWQIKLNSIQQKAGLSALLMFLLSYCLPVGCSSDQESSSSGICRPILICLPNASAAQKTEKVEDDEQYKPIGLVTRNKEADFIGGKLISKCTCGRKDGLGGSDCPRISCQNNPGCRMNPPRCWPQIKLPPPPPPPPPNQNLICLPVELVYYDPSNSNDS